MILMALVCTALTKPLVLLIDRFSSDKSDAYTFQNEEKQVADVTTAIRRMTRSFMGDDFVREFPELDVHSTLDVVNEMSEMDAAQAPNAAQHRNATDSPPSPRPPHASSPASGNAAVSSTYFAASSDGEATASV